MIISLLFACTEGDSLKKINHYIANLKTDSAVKKNKFISQPIDLTPPVSVTYKANVLREPFANKEDAPAKKGTTVMNPLLVYPVTMLRFTGTLFKGGSSFAYLITPDNKLHQVKVGDAIGDHNGKVNAIYYNRIEITEQDSDAGKPLTQRIVTLNLKEESR